MLGRWQVASGSALLLLGSVACGGATHRGAGDDAAGSAAVPPAGMAGSVPVATGGASGGSVAVEPPLSCPELSCVDRDSVSWHPGQAPVFPNGECPYCEQVSSCEGVACSYFGDSLGQPQPLPPELDCPIGYEVGVAAGACCFDCVRNQEPIEPICEGCLEPATICRPGYRSEARPGFCCQVCVADPSYCVADSDCLLATRPADCCACTLGISERQYDGDACYVDPRGPRPTPPWCEPDYDCTVVDCGCPSPPTSVACIENHCTARP